MLKSLLLGCLLAVCATAVQAAEEPATTEGRLSGPLINELIVGAVALPGGNLVIEGNVYHCIRDPGFEYPVCQKIGSTGNQAPQTPAELAAELTAVQQAALWVLPVRPRLNPFGDGGMTELCHPTTHGASGCCRITATLENGDVIVECGTR